MGKFWYKLFKKLTSNGNKKSWRKRTKADAEGQKTKKARTTSAKNFKKAEEDNKEDQEKQRTSEQERSNKDRQMPRSREKDRNEKETDKMKKKQEEVCRFKARRFTACVACLQWAVFRMGNDLAVLGSGSRVL